MKLRTEDDILSKAPITTKLGAKEYSIPLLAVMAQREWRKNLFAVCEPLLESFDFKVESKSMVQGLTAALLLFPEKLTELVFAYREYGVALDSLADVPGSEVQGKFLALIAEGLPEAKDFQRGEILSTATEEQLVSAFSAIMGVAFPFLPSLMTTRQVVTANKALPQ